jgi:hypothetical protein
VLSYELPVERERERERERESKRERENARERERGREGRESATMYKHIEVAKFIMHTKKQACFSNA